MPVRAKTVSLSDHRTSFLTKLREKTVTNDINTHETKPVADLDDSITSLCLIQCCWVVYVC
jgi:hypothetical protein